MRLGSNMVTNSINSEVIRVPEEEEIKRIVWELHPLKSPSPDKFSGIFFRKYWQTVKENVTCFVKEVFRLGLILRTINSTFLVLIPKSGKPNTFSQFRPISLCNFIYKMVSKILTERISEVLKSIISLNQGVFVKGRWTDENTVLA